MGDIRNFVKKTVHEVIQKEYRHIKEPGSMAAKICHVSQDNGIYSYTVSQIDISGKADMASPEIPGIRSEAAYQEGDEVIVLFTGKARYPYIVGRWFG